MEVNCVRCSVPLQYLNKIDNYPTENYNCDNCKHLLITYYGVWHCPTPQCNYDLCNLCKEGITLSCAKCKGPLTFTNRIPKYDTKGPLFSCDHCNRIFNIGSGVHHCFNCDADFDICLECRSKMI